MTLTQAAVLTKRGILGSAVLIVLIITGIFGYRAWQDYQLSKIPPVEEKAEMKFGPLPDIKFPPEKVSSSNFTYSIDTVTGGLPENPKFIKVYFIPQTSISLLSSEKAKLLAENLGFTDKPQIESPTRHKFTNPEGNLSIDLANGNFRLQKAPLPASESAKTVAPFNKESIVEEFRLYLKTRNLLVNELSGGTTNITFNGPSPEKSETAILSILLPDWDNLPMVTTSFNHGLVKTLVSLNQEGEIKFRQIDYTIWPIDETTYSTYTLKTAEQALADLRSGLGFISIEPKNPQVSISSIYLAYLQQEEYTPYLQPVYVFEGPDFAALVPAIAKN